MPLGKRQPTCRMVRHGIDHGAVHVKNQGFGGDLRHLVLKIICTFIIHWIIIYNMQTIVELPEFSRQAAPLLSEDSVKALITHLATHPESGVLLSGTGGVRKLRRAREGMGKSGGTRVIYYFHSKRIPLYRLTIFGKNQRDNLSKAEANESAGLVQLLTQASGV